MSHFTPNIGASNINKIHYWHPPSIFLFDFIMLITKSLQLGFPDSIYINVSTVKSAFQLVPNLLSSS